MKKIKCTILTPEKTFYEGEVDLAVVEAHDGTRGFLINHCPMFSALGIGALRLRTGDSTEQFYVEGGIAEIIDNKMIILAESAMNISDLNKSDIQKEMDELVKGASSERVFLHPSYKKIKTKLKLATK